MFGNGHCTKTQKVVKKWNIEISYEWGTGSNFALNL